MPEVVRDLLVADLPQIDFVPFVNCDFRFVVLVEVPLSKILTEDILEAT